MARCPVYLRALAARDIERTVDHYLGEAGESVTLRFITALERAIVRISSAPLVGTSRFSYELGVPDLRAFPLEGFPYLIFYVPGPDRVHVWRVLHSRRDLPSAIISEIDDLE